METDPGPEAGSFDPSSTHGYADPRLALIEALDWFGPALGRTLGTRPVGVTSYPRLRVVRLVQRRGPQPLGAIARELAVSGATVTGLARGLEQEGLAKRRLGSGDRRLTLLHLTAKGAAVDHAAALQPLADLLLGDRPRGEVIELLDEVKTLSSRLRSVSGDG